MSKPVSSANQDTAANNSGKLKSTDDSDTSLANSSGYSLQSTISGDSLPQSTHKPLNIGNLGKSKKVHTAGSDPFMAKRNSFEEDGTRVFSPAPKPFNQRGAKNNTMSPFFASTASFQPISAFRTPRIPSPTKRLSAASIEELNANQAHTFTPGPLLAVSGADTNGQQAEDSRLSVSANHLNRHKDIDTTKHLDECHETTAEDFDLNEDASRSVDGYNPPPYAVGLQGATAEDHYTTAPLRRVNKRIERNDDVDLEYNTAKRYKVDEEREVSKHFISCAPLA